jgi:nucleoside-diphosphate-sugar epimerase
MLRNSENDVIPRPSPPYGEGFMAYVNSKALAYYATLEWVEENKPSFDVINIQPSFVIGANELTTTVKDMVAGSNALVLRTILGATVDQPVGFNTVHVDDVAYAHVKALDPTVKGGQSFLLSVPMQTGGWNDGIEITKKLFPEAKGKLPLNGSLLSKTNLMDTSKAERELGIKFKPFEEQIKSLVGHLIEVKSAELN